MKTNGKMQQGGRKRKTNKLQMNLETKEDEFSTQPQDILDNEVIHP
jgi:hypothetical protein